MQVTDQDKSRLEKRIRAINSLAQIKHVQRGDVPLDYVMGIGGHDLDNLDLGVCPCTLFILALIVEQATCLYRPSDHAACILIKHYVS